jgi:hypothetical protein
MRKYGSLLIDELRTYDDKKLCEVRQNLIDGNIEELPVVIQDWIRPRTEIKGNNLRIVICVRLLEGLIVRRFIHLTIK